MNLACLAKSTILHEQNLHACSIRPVKNNFILMKTAFFFILVVLMISEPAFSQLEYYAQKDTILKKPAEVSSRHFVGEKKFSLSPNILAAPDLGVKFAGGARFQVFLGKRFSLDADLVIGRDYMHTGPGIIAIPFWLLFFNQSDIELQGDGGFAEFLVMLAAGILSFEHFSYHIPLKNDMEVSPYVNLLRIRQYLPPDDTSGDGAQLAFATGIQMDKYIGRFFISPYMEYSIGYGDHISGFNTGINLGISFPLSNYNK
jgi:hypothetical protein